MKVSPKTQKLFVALIVVLLLGFLGYQVFFQRAPVASDGTAVLTEPASSGESIVALVQKLDKISINQSIFLEPAFGSLRDFTQTISPELRGRPNPFAPIGSDASSPASTQNQKLSSPRAG